MKKFSKPRLAVSACLLGERVRYDGQVIKDETALNLKNFCEIISVCPEVSMGLGVPRKRIIAYKSNFGFGIFQPETGRDLTKKINEFSKNFLDSLEEIDGFLLKSKSPSCGISSATIYRNSDGKEYYGKGKGLFALNILERFSLLPVIDEGRLKNEELKEHFFTRLFAIADMRFLKKNITKIKELFDFHQKYKYLLMSYNQINLKKMGRLIADYDRKKALKDLAERYGVLFVEALVKKPLRGQNINTIIHIFGYLSDNLKPKEKAHFLDLLKQYKNGMIGLNTIREFLKSWSYRFEDEYLMNQVYLEPYPEKLSS